MRVGPIIAAGILFLLAAATWPAPKGEPPLTDDQARENLRQNKPEAGFKDRAIQDVVDSLAASGRVSVVLLSPDGKAPAKTITLDAAGLTVSDAFDRLTAASGLAWAVRDGVVLVATPETLKRYEKAPRLPGPEPSSAADRHAYKRLKETVVRVAFAGKPAMEAVKSLEELVAVQIVVDRSAVRDGDRPITLKLTGVTAGVAAQLLAEQMGLACVIWKGVVFFSSEKDVREIPEADAARTAAEKKAAEEWEKSATPADRALKKLLQEKKVSLDFRDKPAREAFDAIAKLGGIRIVIDATAPGSLRPVTMKWNDATFETVIGAAVNQMGLKSAISKGAVHITK